MAAELLVAAQGLPGAGHILVVDELEELVEGLRAGVFHLKGGLLFPVDLLPPPPSGSGSHPTPKVERAGGRGQ